MSMKTATATRSASLPFSDVLVHKLEEALAEAETTDFHELDDLMAAGVRAGELAQAPRETLHCQLILALAEKAEGQQAGESNAWIREAVELFLSRAG
jgi:hypothetical protein